MLQTRSSGVLLHPTSLPSAYGIGDFGSEAYNWIKMLADCKQSWWQICPLGPTGYGNSPYQCLSTFAGNWALISPEILLQQGLITKAEVDAYPELPRHKVDYNAVLQHKEKLLRQAFKRFQPTKEFDAFKVLHGGWLDDFALFMVLKNSNNLEPWYRWSDSLRLREPAALAAVKDEHADEVDYQLFLQFLFHDQWLALKAFAHDCGVRLFGDIPIYVAYDSSDVWAAPQNYDVDTLGNRNQVAGVPPDFFSDHGQLWGNPLYRWDEMKKNDFAWWIARLKHSFELFDMVRIDHFRAFESFWAVPSYHPDARLGMWEKGPGLSFFNKVKKHLGAVPLVAEDLGMITDKVIELRQLTGMPGMKVLQFAFDGDPSNIYLTYNIEPNSVVYTGTHDNDTSQGWFNALSADRKNYVCEYLGCDENGFVPALIRHAFQSPANLCVLPLQDIIGFGSEHRFNTPGTGEGNWQWRFTWDMVTSEKASRLKKFTELYGRERPREEAEDKNRI